jgi:hypothetical protein
MKTLTKSLIGFSLLFPVTTFGIDFIGYSQKVVPYSNDDAAASSSILGIVDSCGTPTNVDDDCVLKGLERVASEESNMIAYSILGEYARAINEGKFSTHPECHVETHLQANRILAHCTLLLNYTYLKDQDRDKALAQFNYCLQGGLQGLVYQGNIVAQYMLSQFYGQIGLGAPADVWRRAVMIRKDTPDFTRLMSCYG